VGALGNKGPTPILHPAWQWYPRSNVGIIAFMEALAVNLRHFGSADRPHIDKDTFKHIFRDHWDEFKVAHPRYDNAYYNTIIQKMLGCGDPDKMGYVQYRCFHCGQTRRIGFSCKASFCLSCAKVYSDRWVEFIGRRLLPGVVYRHIVLTVPDFLRTWFYRNPSLLSTLMRVGHACLNDLFNTIKKTTLEIGTVIVLQTAGRSGNYNPHLHILITAGGIDPHGTWRSIGYIPFEILHRKWQYHLLSILREKVQDPNVHKDIDRGFKDYHKGFVAHVQKGEVPPGGKGLADYLAKYLVSPPISVRRIDSYDGRSVSYWYKDHRTEPIQHQTLPVLRFIGRMVQHILPKGFQRIRYYGLHSNVRYKDARKQLAALLPSDIPDDPLGFRVIPRKPFAQLFFDAFLKDPLRCPDCGSHMELEVIQHPEYGTIRDYFDEVLDRICDAPEDPTGRSSLERRPQRMVQVPLPFL
jgi:hypothetical protein